jgi:Xaa-Pro dipeptidase
MNNQRLNRLHQLMDKAEFDAVAINPGPSFTYITGMRFHLMERPTVLLISQKADPILVLPKLEALKIQQCPLPIVDFTYDDNPDNWQVAFNDAAKKAGLDGKQIGVEANRLRFLELQFLQTAAPDARFLAAGSAMDDLRIHKDRQEVEYMRHAVDIAQKALTATLPYIGVGVSERTIASELMLQLLRAGSDSDFPFSPIVSGGPNGANPHASPTNRELQSGDLLVIDWGSSYGGYVSDLTRTFAIGDVDEEMRKIHSLVVEANSAGRNAARPGNSAGDVDQAARNVIERAGYGEYFTHRTGHGLGMEGHEHPYVYAENRRGLEEGMAFTVEPGIYLPGVNGVRIEDNIVITANGAESLSTFPRDLQTLD